MHPGKNQALFCIMLAAGCLLAGSAAAQSTIVVPDGGDIQAAIDGASAGDTVFLENGTFTPASTITIDKSLTLEGESEAGVTIDASGVGGYGFLVSASDVTMTSFTIVPTAVNYPIHASGTDNPPSGYDNLTISHVTIAGAHQRTGFDIHGFNHVVLSHLTSRDATGGNGLQITGCVDVDMDNITTSDNQWGSIAIYCSGPSYLNRGCDDVVIDGATLSVGEGPVFSQDEFGLVNTNYAITGFDYHVYNSRFREAIGGTDSEGYTFILDTFADAQAFALSFTGYEAYSAIREIATGDWAVAPGLTIQSAIDHAEAGDTVAVAAGTYEEQLHITKDDLTVSGAGQAAVTVLSPEDLPLFYTTSLDNYPIVFIDGCTGVALNDLTIDGAGRGNANYRFQGVGFWNAGGALTDVAVLNVRDTPFSGAQHGVGVYAYNDTGGPYAVDLTRVHVEGYQKGGIALNGTGLTGNVVDCTTVGAGATDVTAQNGIQFYGSAGGAISGGSVTGNIYTGDGWAASGILLISAGTVDITGTAVSDGDPAVYCQDTDASADGITIANSDPASGNGFYVRIESGLAKAENGELAAEFAPAPFGDADLAKAGSRATNAVTITDSKFTGQGTGYGLAASNYVAADVIAIAMTGTEVSGWGWGVVAFGSGGEIAIEATDNGLFGNGGFFYAADALTTTQDASGNYWGETDPAVLASGVISGDIDYTPWLGGGADLAPGFAGDYSELWVDDDGAQTGAVGRIQEGIDLVDGSTVHVAPGIFVAPAQIVIDKDLDLVGAGRDQSFIQPGFDTTVGNYLVSDALVYVAYDVTATIADLAIDGTGHVVRHAIQSRGAHATVRDCEISHIQAGTYYGRGVVFLTGTGLVQDCLMSDIYRIGVHVRGAVEPVAPEVAIVGLTYTGKGAGDYLDYGVEFGGGGLGTVSGSAITGCLGVASVDDSGSAGILVTDFYGTGTAADIDDCVLTGNSQGLAVGYSDTDLSAVTIHGSTIADNTDYGVSSTGPEVDALGNWWGDSTGPLHPTLNPGGLGNAVTDHVLFEPWLGPGLIDITPATAIINCGDNNTVTVTVRLTLDDYTPPVFGFNVLLNAPAELAWSDPVSLQPFGATTQFLFQDQGGGVYMISGTTQGNPTQPIAAPGVHDLFEVTFTAAAEGVADLTFDSFSLRDPDNQPIAALALGAQVTVDCTAAAAVTGITADPGHEEIDVSWSHDGTGVDHFAVFRGLWYDGDTGESAYPEYDDLDNDVIPTRPADAAAALASTQWEHVMDVPAGTLAITDDLTTFDRGVYYYEVYAVDAATNSSPLAAANDRATNYWLGDINGDGEVEVIHDMTPLGDSFGVCEGDPDGYYNKYVDVGPTDDASRLGIPTTDSCIDFEDLMIFAMNFGVVEGTKAGTTVPEVVDLAWVRLGESRWALYLEDGEGVQGIRVRSGLPGGAAITVVAGQLLEDQPQPTFLRNVGPGLDVNLAVMGRDQGFAGTGELFVVETSVDLDADGLQIVARAFDNSELTVNLLQTTAADIPRVFSLSANYPNPFNPATKIAFSLPEAQPVRLAIYGVDGRLVKVLVREDLAAGHHEVTWLGRDDAGRLVASGTYFYRIEAGPYSAVRKMSLMK